MMAATNPAAAVHSPFPPLHLLLSLSHLPFCILFFQPEEEAAIGGLFGGGDGEEDAAW
jgi:hypothetical protein